ncbi:putative ATP-dependent helicase IRC3 [Tilletia horrida]|nr:putative ATP-dependent helicase IRC3 [Tilletia horrida]
MTSAARIASGLRIQASARSALVPKAAHRQVSFRPAIQPVLDAASSRPDRRVQQRAAYSAAAAVAAAVDSVPDDIELNDDDGPEPDASELITLPKDFGSLILRDYQVECVQECLRTLASGQATRIGVSSPTGSGKTTMFSALLAALPNRPTRTDAEETKGANQILVIVSSIALATQTARAIIKAHPTLHVELEQGTAFHSTGLADVTVATAQTLSRSPARLEKFNPAHFKGVIVDEAHHAAAPSYVSILSHFDPQVSVPLQKRGEDGSPPSSGIPIIGFSATFARHDGVALGKVFQRIVYHKDFLEMVNDKWLSPVRFTSVRTKIDLASVPTSSKTHDFRTSALSEVMNTRAINQVIVRTWLDRAGITSTSTSTSEAGEAAAPRKMRRTTLIFAVNVAHVIDLTQAFRDAGVDARYVHGGQRPALREEVIRDFAEGKFPVLVNCAVLTEGADIPPIDCLILARPTRSRNVFMQMLGRGLRLSPGTNKEDCLVLDVVGATERGVMCTPTLFGLDVSDIIEDATIDDLRQRAEQKVNESEPIPPLNDETAGEADFSSASDVQLPRKVTYIDFESPEALQAAMLAPATSLGHLEQAVTDASVADGPDGTKRRAFEAYIPIEKLSSNAWVDCGGGVFVMEIPPAEGYVKIRKTGIDDADNDTAEPEPKSMLTSDEEANWVAHYYPRGPSAADFDASPMAASMKIARRGSFFVFRPRHILDAATLDAAIRGADTYIERSVLRGAMTRVALCRRRAEWRLKQATGPQKDLIRKRLGYSKTTGTGKAASTTRKSSNVGEEPGNLATTLEADPLAHLTKGQASLILTRLNHGAKNRWQTAAKAHNRELKQSERMQKKAELEADKEERKMKRLAERERESERRRSGIVEVGDL